MITTKEDISYWLALVSIPKMGIANLLSSAQYFDIHIQQLREIPTEALQSIGWNTEQVACISEPTPFTDRTVNWLKTSKTDLPRYIITYDCAEYPAQLKEISQPPLMLFVEGDHSLISQTQLAVVGSRHPSIAGINAVKSLVTEITSHSNMIITSGLALGIDAHAHRACLENHGKTVAVLGCGIDVIYPQRHKELYARIKNSGALVSEFPPSVMPSPKLFPRRNRIISGLSWGTLVAEAKIKSGSLVTAKYAAEQGREVFAIPSNINNPLGKGCHWLIKQGAKLVECAQDIFDEQTSHSLTDDQEPKARKKTKQSLASNALLDSVATVDEEKKDSKVDDASTPSEQEDSEQSDLILQAIDYDITSIDDIAKRSGEALPVLLPKLLEYELRGIVASSSGGYLKLRA